MIPRSFVGPGILALATACAGGSGAGGPPTAIGALTVSGCVIAENDSTCLGAIAWTTVNAASPRVLLGDATLSTAPTGSLTLAVGAAPRTVSLLDGAARLDEASIGGACVTASAWDGSRCRAFARRLSARAPTPFVEGGRAVSLEVVIFKPFGEGPFPAVMFHHGSTGDGSQPSLFTITYTNEVIARFFADRGWLIAFAQRRGRGKSDGLYDEGFTPDRSRYSCLQGSALAGFQRALQDVEAATAYVRSRTDVDTARLLSAGASRGGILSVVHAAERPGLFEGAVNFVGGWLGEGCADATVVNRSLAVSGARFEGPTLWLYGENDSFYSLAHSRANFEAFVAAGGQGAFKSYTRAPTLNGHFIVNEPALWTPDLDAFVGLVGR